MCEHLSTLILVICREKIRQCLGKLMKKEADDTEINELLEKLRGTSISLQVRSVTAGGPGVKKCLKLMQPSSKEKYRGSKRPHEDGGEESDCEFEKIRKVFCVHIVA